MHSGRSVALLRKAESVPCERGLIDVLSHHLCSVCPHLFSNCPISLIPLLCPYFPFSAPSIPPLSLDGPCYVHAAGCVMVTVTHDTSPYLSLRIHAIPATVPAGPSPWSHSAPPPFSHLPPVHQRVCWNGGGSGTAHVGGDSIGEKQQLIDVLK